MGVGIEARVRGSQEGQQQTATFSLFLLSKILPKNPTGLTLQWAWGPMWYHSQGAVSPEIQSRVEKGREWIWGRESRGAMANNQPQIQCFIFLAWLSDLLSELTLQKCTYISEHSISKAVDDAFISGTTWLKQSTFLSLSLSLFFCLCTFCVRRIRCLWIRIKGCTID